MDETDIAGVSRLPRERFPTGHVVLDSVGVTSDSPLAFDITIAFLLSGQGRPPQKGAHVSGVTVELNNFLRLAPTHPDTFVLVTFVLVLSLDLWLALFDRDQ